MTNKNNSGVSEELSRMIPIIRDYFDNQPIETAWLFGSYSRGEASDESDIDILVRYVNPSRLSLLDIARINSNLGKLLGKRVDLIEDECLMPFARESADNDKILIYERAV